MKRLVLLNTVGRLSALFDELCAELLPGVSVEHVVDEPLLRGLEGGKGQGWACARVSDACGLARDAGADAVLLTCSSISPCAQAASRSAGLPVLRIDGPMMEEAARLADGGRAAILATSATTVEPSRALLLECARKAGREFEAKVELCARGEVVEAAERLARGADVLVLAQASMSGFAAELTGLGVPVLTSPRSGLLRAGRLLGVEAGRVT